MPASMYDQLLDPEKSFLSPMLALNQMAMQLYGNLGKEHLKMMNELMLCHAEQLQELSHAKKLENIMEIQAQWMTKTMNPLNEYAQHMIDAALESNASYTKWLEDNYQKKAQEMKEGIKESKHLQEKALGKK